MKTCTAFDIPSTLVTRNLDKKCLEWKLPSISSKYKNDDVHVYFFPFAFQESTPSAVPSLLTLCHTPALNLYVVNDVFTLSKYLVTA